MLWQYTRPTSNLVLGSPHLQQHHHHSNQDMGPVLVHIEVVHFATVPFINHQNKGTVQTAMKRGVLKRVDADQHTRLVPRHRNFQALQGLNVRSASGHERHQRAQCVSDLFGSQASTCLNASVEAINVHPKRPLVIHLLWGIPVLHHDKPIRSGHHSMRPSVQRLNRQHLARVQVGCDCTDWKPLALSSTSTDAVQATALAD